jgi:hypothetical protein
MTEKSWNESEVDALLRGSHPHDPELIELVPVVAALRARLETPVAEGRVSEVSSRLAVAAREAHSNVPAHRRKWSRKVIITGIAAVALGTGFAGVAAADSAAPGDPLYGVDKALENVGINDGGFAERLDEANELVDEGADDAAVALLADALDDEGDSEGKRALLDAAAKIRGNGSEQSADVHAAVAAMLTWMATTDATGKDFGQGVAERAREIHGKSVDATATPTPTHTPTDEATARPANPGKPDDAGKPTAKPSATPQPTTEPQATAEPQDTRTSHGTGKPDTAGKPTDKPDKGKP